MSQKWWVLSAVGCGTFMATLDSSIVNIALPTLTHELSTDISRVKWVVISYLLIITCMILPLGRLSDQIGRKKVFFSGLFVFTLGSLFCAFSSHLTWLIISRIIQGCGASMLMANGPAIIAGTFSAQERGKALGILAMIVSAGLVTGPSLGGFLIAHLSWQYIFLVNLPVGALGLYLILRYIPRDKKDHNTPQSFDWPGSFLQFVVIMLFILLFDPPSISLSGGMSFALSPYIVGGLLLIFGSIFVKWESQIDYPIFDLSLLKNRSFWTANLASFLMFVVYSGGVVLIPFYLEQYLGLNTDHAGFLMTAIPLTIFVVAPLSGRLSDRFGSRELSFAGALTLTLSFFLISGAMGQGLHGGSSTWSIVILLASIGMATGLFQSPNNNAIMGAVPQDKLGTASALLATVRNLGLVVGTGLAAGIYAWKRQMSGDFLLSIHFTFLAMGVIGVIAMLVCLGKPKGRHY